MIRAYSTPMGNSLGRKAQATIDQLSLWDSAFDASNDSVSSPVDPPAGAQSGGAVAPVVLEEPEPAGVGQPQSAVLTLPRSHCPAGHPYDADNTYVSRQGWRSCRTCKRLSDRRRRARALLVGLRGEGGAVACAGLEVEEDLEVPGVGPVGLGQQGYRLLVVVTLGVLTEAGAADDVGGGDAGVDAERHVGRRSPGRRAWSRSSRPPGRTGWPWPCGPLGSLRYNAWGYPRRRPFRPSSLR